jgi:hypothetical protein
VDPTAVEPNPANAWQSALVSNLLLATLPELHWAIAGVAASTPAAKAQIARNAFDRQRSMTMRDERRAHGPRAGLFGNAACWTLGMCDIGRSLGMAP